MTRHERPVPGIGPTRNGSLLDVRSAVKALRDLRKEIAARPGGESRLTDAQVKCLIEAGRR